MGIYKTEDGKAEVLRLYESQLARLGLEARDLWVDTGFGRTHLLETGNPGGKPLLVFHGGNSTSAYNLLACRFLLADFHVYAVDIVGHPGKSAEGCLPPYGYAYGKWAAEVIDGLGQKRMLCFGGSFGGGVLAKLLCVAPEKVSACVLLVPSGVGNALPIGTMKMLKPMVKYLRTHEERYIRETALHMAVREEALDADTLAVVKSCFDHVKTKVGMPTNVSAKRAGRYHGPVLVMAGEFDCLFPARTVLPRARRIFPQSETYLLKGRGHLHRLTPEEEQMILLFLSGKNSPTA